MKTLKLNKPIMIDGKEKTEIEYDFESLTGHDIQQATKEVQQQGIVIASLELDSNYHAALFSRASGLMYSDMARLSIKDYTKAVAIARNFSVDNSEE